MKTFFSMFLITIAAFFILSELSYAQAGDTLVVAALTPDGQGGNLDRVIRADTLADGSRNPNRVYLLQQTGELDTTYFINQRLIVNYNLTIVGKPNPVTGGLPVIAPLIHPDNSSIYQFIRVNSGSVTLKNLFITSWRADGKTMAGQVVRLQGNNTKAVIDHCVFDGFNDDLLSIGASYCNLFVSNCEFRDIVGAGASWVGAARPVDTLSFVNNTFFFVDFAYFGDLGYIKHLQFEHNTGFYETWIPLNGPQLTDAVIRNNIFFGTAAMGADSALIKGFWANTAANHFGYAVFFLDSLSTVANAPYNFKESDRNITIENNVYCWPQPLYTYWKTVSDTAKDPGLLTPPQWMDSRTAQMFNDKTSWPNLNSANNDSTDPGFSASLVQQGADSLVKYINLLWTQGTGGAFRPNIYQTDPLNVYKSVPSNWATTQGYPVPENLRYSNVALQTAGTDGKALGDLNWFPEQLTDVKEIPNAVPTEYRLSQNYPNPFNPVTNINYAIPKSGFVSLKVYNILGQEVAVLHQGFQTAGSYKADFDASQLSSGVYMYRLESNGFSLTKKMVLLK